MMSTSQYIDFPTNLTTQIPISHKNGKIIVPLENEEALLGMLLLNVERHI